MINKPFYIEVSSFGIILLIIMMYYLIKSRQRNNTVSEKLFSGLLVVNGLLLISDMCVASLNGCTFVSAYVLLNVFGAVYYSLHAYFVYLWFWYCAIRLFPEYNPSEKMRWLTMLPCIISAAVSILSPFSGLVFSINKENIYERGECIWIVMAISYMYWAAAIYMTLRKMIHAERNREKSVYITLVTFPIPVVIGTVIQMKLQGLTVIWICTALALLVVFTDVQNKQLSIDSLTGLYNRMRINKEIAWEISNLSKERAFYIIMTDVDRFKFINDEYGHIIGDKALVSVSGILKKSVPGDAFLGRFGGDEFVIIGHINIKNKDAVNKYIVRINKMTENFNLENGNIYKLSLSTGYSVFTCDDRVSVDGVISAADKAMYREKLLKK